MKTVNQDQASSGECDWSVLMERALTLSARVLTTTPNPRVGCVIWREGEIVGEGWHVAAGLAHAEVNALQAAGERARGSTVVVSLEPCAHEGRTGPCAHALVAAQVARVVIACLDPNPEVSGGGVRVLEDAGIEVLHLVDQEAAARTINRGYFKRREQGLPWVTLKLAMSLDGRIALASGDSKWITSAAARGDVQRLRASSSAILTGINTVLEDDPSLNVRVAEMGLSQRESADSEAALARQPLRAVLDSKKRMPTSARLLEAEGEVVIFTGAMEDMDASFREGVTVRSLPPEDGRVPLRSVLESLAADYHCNEVLVESGAELAASFIASGLLDELVVYVAPKLLGSDGKALLNLQGPQALADAREFEILSHSSIGDDIKLVLKPKS